MKVVSKVPTNRSVVRPNAVRLSKSANMSAGSWLLLEVKKQPLRECGNCSSVYFDGHWHQLRSKSVKNELRKKTVLLESECEACRLEREAHGPVGAVGEVRIGAVPARHVLDVMRTIRNVGKTALKRDQEERIIAIEESGQGFRVTTTQNQLAVRIGKKLDSAFKGGQLAVKYSAEDSPVLVRWTPPLK